VFSRKNSVNAAVALFVAVAVCASVSASVCLFARVSASLSKCLIVFCTKHNTILSAVQRFLDTNLYRDTKYCLQYRIVSKDGKIVSQISFFLLDSKLCQRFPDRHCGVRVCVRVCVDGCVQPAVFVWIGQYFEESDYFDDAACDHFALLAVLHMYMCMYTLYVYVCIP